MLNADQTPQSIRRLQENCSFIQELNSIHRYESQWLYWLVSKQRKLHVYGYSQLETQSQHFNKTKGNQKTAEMLAILNKVSYCYW